MCPYAAHNGMHGNGDLYLLMKFLPKNCNLLILLLCLSELLLGIVDVHSRPVQRCVTLKPTF